jgi:hypothetical protein
MKSFLNKKTIKELEKKEFESSFGYCEECGAENPTADNIIQQIREKYPMCSFAIGGGNTWWAVIRDENNQKALVPVQMAITLEEALLKIWLYKK